MSSSFDVANRTALFLTGWINVTVATFIHKSSVHVLLFYK